MRTLKELAQEALDVQDASNLSGVVHSFSRAISELRQILKTPNNYMAGVDVDVNTHPICVLYSSKIASMTNSEATLWFSHAYDDCVRWAER